MARYRQIRTLTLSFDTEGPRALNVPAVEAIGSRFDTIRANLKAALDAMGIVIIEDEHNDTDIVDGDVECPNCRDWANEDICPVCGNNTGHYPEEGNGE